MLWQTRVVDHIDRDVLGQWLLPLGRETETEPFHSAPPLIMDVIQVPDPETGACRFRA